MTEKTCAGRDAERGATSSRAVRDLIQRLERQSSGDKVSLRDLVETGAEASFVPALVVPALLVVSPLSGIPFFSSICGLLIAAITLQMLWRRDHLSLPGFIMNRKLDGSRLRAALKRLHGPARFIDRLTRAGRLPTFTGKRGMLVPQALCLAAGAAMPVLEIVPFSSSILGAGVLALSVGMLTRDGVFVIIGAVVMASAAGVAIFAASTI